MDEQSQCCRLVSKPENIQPILSPTHFQTFVRYLQLFGNCEQSGLVCDSLSGSHRTESNSRWTPACGAGFALCATPVAGNVQIFLGGLRYAL